MQTLFKFLSENPNGFMATTTADGRPKVRPFGFMFEEVGRLYFCTANTKPVFKEMQEQPWVEYSAMSPDFRWARVEGKAVFVHDPAIKARVLECHPMVKNLYQTPDNPVFEVFYLAEATATLSGFAEQTQSWNL